MKKILTIREMLIDFICLDKNKDLSKGVSFEKKAGGAPANVAAVVSLLGGESSILGNVGNDSLGIFLVNKMKEYNVDTSLKEKKIILRLLSLLMK